MKKILLILVFTFSIGASFGQPGVFRTTDVLNNANALGEAQVKTFNELTEINTRTIRWLVSDQHYRGVHYISYVDPESFNWYNKKNNDEYNAVINKVIDRLEIETVSGISRLSNLEGRPTLEIYFLSGSGIRPNASTVWSWDITDFHRIGTLAFTIGPNNQRLRRIAVSGKYRPTDEYRLMANILHSLGHIFHEDRLGVNSYWGEQSLYHTEAFTKRWPQMSHFTQALTSAQISGRAQYSRSEYVAEAFSYISMGTRGSIMEKDMPAVLAEYEYLLGPKLKYFESRKTNK